MKVKASLAVLPPSLLAKALWTTCALSRQAFREPVVADALGHMFNKESVVQYLLGRSERLKEAETEAANAPSTGSVAAKAASEEDAVAGHLRGLKDVTQLQLGRNPAFKAESTQALDLLAQEGALVFPFVDPLTGKELSGKQRCIYLRSCGCVFTEASIRAVASEAKASSSSSDAAADSTRQCPSCGKSFRAGSTLSKGKPLEPGELGCDVIVLNPTDVERAALRECMLAERAQAAAKKASKKNGAALDDASEDKGSEAKRKRKAEKKAAKEEQIRALQAELAAEDEKAQQPAAKRSRIEDEGSTSERGRTGAGIPGADERQHKRAVATG